MKTRKLLLLLVLLISVSCVMVGCSIINIFREDSGESVQLATPKNITLASDGSTLSWSIIPNAASYKIRYELGGKVTYAESQTNTFTIPDNIYGELNVKVCAISNKSKFTDSEYSEAYLISSYATLTLDLSSFSSSVDEDSLTISWAEVENADKYSLKITKGNETEIIENTDETFFTVQNYNPLLRYQFVLTAEGSGWFKSSAPATYTKSATADFTNVQTLDYDKLEPQAISIPFDYASSVKVNEQSFSDKVTISENEIVFSTETLNSLSVGNYRILIENGYSLKTLIIGIADNRAPIITIADEYLKDGSSLIGTLQLFGTEFSTLKYAGSTLGSDKYAIAEQSISISCAYLDNLSTGRHTFELSYRKPNGEEDKLNFSITVKSTAATLTTSSYDFYGNGDLQLSLKTNGDTVTAVYAGSELLTEGTDYFFDKNSLIITQEYLSSGATTDFYFLTNLSSSHYNFTVSYKLNGFVPSATVYIYDKSDNSDLTVNGIIHCLPVYVYGNMLTSSDYEADETKGIILSKTFLSQLALGEHEFMACCDNEYSYFSVKVTASNGTPYNVKINTDISSSATYITFDCDCGENKHFYSLDSGATYSCARPQQLSSFVRTAAHTLTVSCSTFGTHAFIDYDKPADNAVPYMESYFSFGGEQANRFIESTDELSFLLQYLAYGGGGAISRNSEYVNGYAQLEVCFSADFNSYIQEHSDYFNLACSGFETAWSCQYSLRGKDDAPGVCIITAAFNSYPEHTISSGTSNAVLSDTRAFLSSGDRGSSFSAFAINSCTVTEAISSTEELAILPFGIKPVFAFNSNAKSAYEAALNICRTYISSDMTELEKVTAIYHWVTSNITYDNNALVMYEVKNTVCGANYELSSVRNYLNGIIVKHPDMEHIFAPVIELTSTEAIQNELSAQISKMRAFTLEGALLDKVAVCDGISSAFRLLCQIEGITCIKVSGKGITNSGSENHAWNKVLLDGKWYIVDATWGKTNNYISHRYFLTTEEYAISTHIENDVQVGSESVAVVDIIARGGYDYMKDQVYDSYDMVIESEQEFRTVVSALVSGGETVIEFRLDFDYDTLDGLLSRAHISCSYISSGDYLIIIL